MTKVVLKVSSKVTARLCAAVLLLPMLLASAQAFAACTTPAGVGGDIIYNTTYARVQYCNGTDWINMGSAGNSLGVGTLIASNFCTSDGSVINCTTPTISLTTQVSGALQAAQFPALTGDVTTTLGSLATTVARINGVALGSTTATSGNLLIGSGTTWVSTAVSGDITLTAGGVTAIGSSKVTNAMLAGSINISKILATGTASSTTYLRGDGTWSSPSAGLAIGGANTQVQFNSSGALAGDSGFTYAGSGAVTINGAATTALSSTTSAAGGTGVYGYASSATGISYGGKFWSDSASGRAVAGVANSTSGSSFAGYFYNYSSTGTGVQGIAASVTGANYGGYFESDSASGTSLAAGAGNATTKVLVLSGANSQTANLAEFQNNSGTVLSSITSAGVFTGPGSGLTTLNASNLSSGTVGTARLGTGTASSTTWLRGDGTWSALGTGTPTSTTWLRGDGTWSALGTGTANSTTYLRGDGTWATPAAGLSIGGSNTQVQFNNSGALAGDSGFTYAGSGALTVTGAAATALSVTTSSVSSAKAVYGVTTGTSGNTYAVYGDASANTSGVGYGVYGAGGGSGYGVYGTSAGYGVYGSSSSGGGLYGNSTSGQGVVANSSSGYGLYSTSTSGTAGYFASNGASGISLLSEAGNAATKGFVVKGAASQSGDLAQFQNSSSTVLSRVDANGYFVQAASGYYNFGATAGTSGYGIRDNAGTIECKNSGGAWAACASGGASTFAAGTVSLPGWAVTGDTDTGLWAPAANTLSVSAGGVEVQRWNTVASGVNYFSMTPGAAGLGVTMAAAGADTNININLTPKGAGGIVTSGSAATQFSSTTSNVSGIAVYGVASAVTGANYGGYFLTGGDSGAAVYGRATGASGATYGGIFQSGSSTGTSLYAVAGDPGAKGLVVKAAASQTADLAQFQTSTGTVVSKVDATGNVTLPMANFAGAAGGAGVNGSAGSAAGTSGQVQYNSSGTFAGAAGLVYSTSGTITQTTAQAATDKPLVVKGAASQSANLMEIQNSGGTALVAVDSNGSASVTNAATSTFTATNSSTTNNIAAVTGNATGTSGNTYAGYFRNYSTGTNAIAVYGYASASSGATYGVYGNTMSNSNNAIGVLGTAMGGAGITYGGYFYSTSASGIGVYAGSGNAASKPLVVQGAASQTGDLAQFQNSSGTVLTVVNSAGSVGIGTATPGYKLDVNGNTRVSGSIAAVSIATTGGVNSDATGGTYPIYATANGASVAVYGGQASSSGHAGLFINSSSGYYCYMGYNNTYSLICSGPTSGVSDQRLKKDVRPLDDSEGLSALMQIRPVHYRWRDDRMNSGHPNGEIGFLAQNVESVLPTLVSETAQPKDAVVKLEGGKQKSLQYDRLAAPIIKAIQELKHMFDALVAKVDGHDEKIKTLEASVDTLKHDNESLRRDVEELKNTVKLISGHNGAAAK